MTTDTNIRGRKNHDRPDEVQLELDPVALAERSQAIAEVAQIQAGYSEERDLVNQLLGQAQALTAISDFSRLSAISKIAFVQETKAYKAIAGTKTADGRLLSGTFEEFCELLGMSVSKAKEDITNLRTFGEQTLEALSSMGIGYREMRQYRRLPEDGQQALMEIAKTGDKEALLDLAEELIAKQVADKEKLNKALSEVKADVTAKDAVIADKSARIDALETTVQKIKTSPPDEQSVQIRNEASHLCFDIEARIRGQLAEALETALSHATDHGIDIDAWLGGELDQIDDALLSVRERLCMPREVR